jgi:predicted nucleic acid-binding protein
MNPVILLADASVFLRFLRNDDPEHSPAARRILEQAAAGEVILRVQEIVVADIFYTLTAPMMKIPRATAARQISALLQQPGLEVENRSRILEILARCETKNVDYGDGALIVAAQAAAQPILSFDKDFRKEPAVTAFSPVEWRQKGRRLLKPTVAD